MKQKMKRNTNLMLNVVIIKFSLYTYIYIMFS